MAGPNSFQQGRGGRREEDSTRINGNIRANKIRLIDADGELVGVVPVQEGIKRAEEVGLDLVEVSPNADPPVCKILDYGKFRYEAQKKAKAAKKNQKVVHVKEIKIRPNIEKHDYEVKMKSIRRFIEDGDKVKVSLRFRGREMAHQEIGMELLKKIQSELSEVTQTEYAPRMEGRQLIMILAPK